MGEHQWIMEVAVISEGTFCCCMMLKMVLFFMLKVTWFCESGLQRCPWVRTKSK